MRKHIVTGAVVVTAIAGTTQAQHIWQDPAGGSWHDPTNWNTDFIPPGGSSIPSFQENTAFNGNANLGVENATFTTTFAGGDGVTRLIQVGDGNDVTLDLLGNTLTINQVNSRGEVLSIRDGALRLTNGHIAGWSGVGSVEMNAGTGLATLDIAASTASFKGLFIATGSDTAGQLMVADGANVNLAGGDGRFTVGGATSSPGTGAVAVDSATVSGMRLDVGPNGTLDIVNGGRVLISGDQSQGMILGDVKASGDGTQLQIANASTLTNLPNSIDIGRGGSLQIEEGATFDSGHLIEIGPQAGGTSPTITVTGHGSKWSHVGPLGVGIRSTDGGRGFVTFDDGAIGTINGDVFVGVALAIAADGSVIRSNNGGYGHVLLGSESELTVDGTIFLGPDTRFNPGRGDLSIDQTATLKATRLVVTDDSTVTVFGTMIVNDLIFPASSPFVITSGTLSAATVHGNLSNAGAIIAPGESPGTMTIDGDYTQDDGGALQIEVAGLIPGDDFDLLEITGTATLNGGTLDVVLLQGDYFIPALTEIDVLTAGTLIGTFDTFDLPTDSLGAPLFAPTVDPLTGMVSLTATQDIDGNTVPEPALALWLALGGIAAVFLRRKPRPLAG